MKSAKPGGRALWQETGDTKLPGGLIAKDDPYTKLQYAIVIQAVDDYRTALRKLKRGTTDPEVRKTKKECEQFFSSAWCKYLTDVNMVEAARHIRQEVLEDR